MIWALWWKLGEVEPEQLDLFESPKQQWVGPMFWPDADDIETAKENFLKSLEGRPITCRIDGYYEKEGEKWQLIPYN